MAGVIAGNGLGVFDTSLEVVGPAGMLGSAGVLGQAGGEVFVNAATGNLILRAVDERLSGRGPDLLWQRTLNSLDTSDVDGDGWRWDGQQTVILEGDNSQPGSAVVRTGPDGHRTRYDWNGSRYSSGEGGGAHDTIAYDSGPKVWQWVRGSARVIERYSAATGRLISRHDISGNSVTFQHDADGRFTGMTDPGGKQCLTLTYAPIPANPNLTRPRWLDIQTLAVDVEGRVTGTLGAPVRKLEYGYDADGRLTTVTCDLTPPGTTGDPDYLTTYTYTGSRITGILQSDGTSASFTYDQHGRVHTVTDTGGERTFDYVDLSGSADPTVRSRTDLTIPGDDGQPRTWSLLCDGARRLTGIDAPAPTPQAPRPSTRFGYDDEGNLVRVVDARGNAVTYGYDARGNRTLERDALGDTIVSTFDARNQLGARTRYLEPDPDGAGPQSASMPVTTRLVYDGQSRLRFTVSAEGLVTEQRYGTSGGDSGLVTRVLRHTGGRYDLSGLTPAAPLTETRLASWVSTQDASRVQLTCFDHDLLGNLARRTDFARVDASGTGVLDAAASVTEFVHDAHGELVKTIAVRGGARDRRAILASGVHDGLGRPRQLSDSGGTRTIGYEPAQRRIRTIDSAGLTHSSQFDARGHLVAVDQDDGDTVRGLHHVYDAAGRRRLTLDAIGGRRFRFYDDADRLQYTVDATGAVTGFEHDACGRFAVETRYATVVDTAGWYDASANTVTKSTLVPGADFAVDADRDRLTRFGYDEADRLTTTTHADGTVTHTTYDGLSRIVRLREGDRVTRFFHDGDDRLIGEVDALGYLTEHRYDTAGRRVETLRYHSPGPAAENTDAPVWVGVTDLTAVAGRPFEYRLPAFDADGAALTYSLAGTPPSWLDLDPGTATLTGTPPTEPGTYPVTVRADDGHGNTADATFAIAAVNTGPQWSVLADQAVATDTAGYRLVLPEALDNEPQPQLTYTLRTTLPTGLGFDAAQRAIHGTPTQPGVYAVTARVTDGRGLFTDRTFTLTVVGKGLSWAAVGPQEAPVGERFFFEVPAAVDPEGWALTYSAVAMPSWLGFNTKTLLLSGMPPFPETERTVVPKDSVLPPDPTGSGEVVLRARNPLGATVTLSFWLEVSDGWSQMRTMAADAANAATTASAADAADAADPLAAWRGADGEASHTHLFHDSLDRLIGSVDERGFLSETAYDEQANTRLDLRYPNPVTVAPGDSLATLRPRAGTARETGRVEYDDFGRVSRQTHTDGSVTRREYDGAGRMVREVTAAGTAAQRANRARYDAFGQVTGTLGGAGEAGLPGSPSPAEVDAAVAARGLRVEYDALGRRTRTIDPHGQTTLFFYDGEHRLTHTITAEAEVTETEYDGFGQPVRQRRYATRMTPQQLDGLTGGSAAQLLNRLPQPDPDADEVIRHHHDRRGRLVERVDGEGNVMTRTYDALGLLSTETRDIASGRTVTNRFYYDRRGGLVSDCRDHDGHALTTLATYDAHGRVLNSVNPEGQTTVMAYGDGGRTVEATDAAGRITRTEYDAFGRISVRVDAAGERTEYDYDDVARTVQVTSPAGVRVTTRQTEHGELLAVVDGCGGVTGYEYNADGQLAKVTDALGNVIRSNEYDAAGRLSYTTDARGATVHFSYDGADRVTERRSTPENQRTVHEFNALGQQVKVTEGFGSPAARVTSYRYDRNGRPLQVVVDPDGLGLSTRYTYDGLGNAVLVEQGTTASPSQRATRYEYDNAGRRVTEIVAPSSVLGAGDPHARDLTTGYRYDDAGRLTRTIDANGHSTWNVYDEAGQLSHVINAEGEVVRHDYDANGRTVHTRRYVNRLSAEVLGGLGDVPEAVTPAEDPGDQRRRLVYDADGRVRFTLTASEGTKWTISEDRHDANGNVVESRRYDRFLPEVRLEDIDTAASPGVSVAEITAELSSLGYNDSGAALAKVRRMRFAYDANNRLRFTVDAQGSVSETAYDAAGNVVAEVRYATRPALTAITVAALDAAVDRGDPGNQVTHYAYDSAGRRRFTVRMEATDAQGIPKRQLVTEYGYDACDRTVQVTEYATTVAALTGYDADTIAAAVAASNKDQCEAFVYDGAGRRIHRIRLLKTDVQDQHLVTTLEYNPFGQLVRQTAFAAAMALSDFARATVDAAVAASTGPHDRSTSYVYDAAGRQRFTVAADGTLSETEYDAAGRVVEQRRFDVTVDNATPRTVAALNAKRGNRAVGDGVTRGEIYDYDRAGRVRTVTDARGETESSEYNGVGDLRTHTDKNGHVCAYHYDRQGRVTRKVFPPVEVYSASTGTITLTALADRTYYNAFGDIDIFEQRCDTEAARVTEYEYDTLGRLTRTLLPGYYHPVSERVINDAITGVSEGFRREVSVGYDALGNPVSTATRTGVATYQREYKTYDPLGRTVHDIDALGHVINFGYTPFGEQERVTKHSVTISGTPANTAYWTVKEIADHCDGDTESRTTDTDFDTVGRKKAVRQPNVNHYHGDFHFRANTATVIPVAAQATTRYEYNAFGDLRHEEVKLNDTEWRDTWRYFDTMGRQIRHVDDLGHHTQHDFDAFGNLKLSVEYAKPGSPGGGDATVPSVAPNDSDRITTYTYNALDQQTSVRRLGLRYTRWNGSAYEEVVNNRDTATTVAGATFDGYGRVLTRVDAAGNITQFEYNALGQLTVLTEPARSTAGTGVDPFLDVVTATPQTILTLDAFGNIATQTRTPGGGPGETLVSTQHYDHAGNLTTGIDPMGGQTNRFFDHAGRVIRETQSITATLGDWLVNNHTLERRYAYDVSGHQTDALDVFAAGATLTQSGLRTEFNAFGEVERECRVFGPASAALSQLTRAVVATNSYDDAGRLTTRIAADGVSTFHYGFTGRVTRQEHRAHDGSGVQITETGYDSLSRAVTQRLPWFTATVPEYGPKAVTPLVSQEYDRWNNVVSRTKGRYVFNESRPGPPLPVPPPGKPITTSYAYNADDQLTVERLPVEYSEGTQASDHLPQVRHELRYDLLGRVVRELDFMDDLMTSADEAVLLRARGKRYNEIGQQRHETDATGITNGCVHDAHGNRIGERNALGIVYVDEFDRNGNLLKHKVLRRADETPYRSGTDSTVNVSARWLNWYRYDQANRRFAEADVIGSAAIWRYTKFDERGQVRAVRDGSGVVVTHDFDALGNRTRERDANGNEQTWAYSTADHAVGRLLSSTVGGGRTTGYGYNGFGQLATETRPGPDNLRSYEYHENGLLKRLRDKWTVGVRGPGGGADYSTSDTVSQYEYTSTGLVCVERVNQTGVEEFAVEQETGPYISEYTKTPVIRAVHTAYDAMDRVAVVTAPPAENPGRDSMTVLYRYDGLGNRTNVRADYVRAGSTTHAISDQWYTYDKEGRMTTVDGVLQNGQVRQGRGTTVVYDGLGRRQRADKFVKSESDQYLGPNFTLITETWDRYQTEWYAYDDLDRLETVQQQQSRRNRTIKHGQGPVTSIPDETDPDIHVTERRKHNARGDLIECRTYSPYTGALETTALTSYRGDGQLSAQSRVAHGKPDKDTVITNHYDAAGVLGSYTYRQGGGTSSDFTNTYTYEYNMEFGGYKETRQTVTTTRSGLQPGATTSRYDAGGQLLSQSTDDNYGNRKGRLFTYDADSHILTKSEYRQTTGDPSEWGKQDNTYAQDQLVAILGTGTLATAQFSNGFTAISSAYPGNRATGHVVRSGDTLAEIAQLVFGDSAMWFLIAEANNLSYPPHDPLPSVEIGKTYRIPNVVANFHYTAATFLPYNPAAIIGDLTPVPVVPPPPPEMDLGLRILITVAAAAAATVVTVYTAGAGTALLGSGLAASFVSAGAGAAAGSAAGQLVTIGLGPKEIEEFSFRQVAVAGLAAGAGNAVGAAGGAVGGSFGKIVSNPYTDIVESYLYNQGANSLLYWSTPDPDSLWSLATELGVYGAAQLAPVKLSTRNFKWGNATQQVAANALNPHSGWILPSDRSRDWDAILNQAVGAYTKVAVKGAIQKIKEVRAEQRKTAKAAIAWQAKFAPDSSRERTAAGGAVESATILLTGASRPMSISILENDELVAETEGVYHGGNPWLDTALLGTPEGEVIYIENRLSEDEKSRLAGNTNIVSEQEHNRQLDFHDFKMPWLNADKRTRPKAPPRPPYHLPEFVRQRKQQYREYRKWKRAEYHQQMRRIDNAAGAANLVLTYLATGVSISTIGFVATAKEFLVSDLASRGAKAAGFGETGQFVAGMLAGGLVTPRVPSSGRLVPDDFNFRARVGDGDADVFRAPERDELLDPLLDQHGNVPFVESRPDMPGSELYEVNTGSQLGKMYANSVDNEGREFLRVIPERGPAKTRWGDIDAVSGQGLLTPDTIGTQHTHSFGYALPSGRDIRTAAKQTLHPDTTHQIVGDKWPNTQWLLQHLELEPVRQLNDKPWVFRMTTRQAREYLDRHPNLADD